MIDPACGSGHFLLGSFARLLDRWRRKEPGMKAAVLAQRCSRQRSRRRPEPIRRWPSPAFASCWRHSRNVASHGSRMRLRLTSISPAATHSSTAAPAATRPRWAGARSTMLISPRMLRHWARMLRPKAYHAVVANPPYITPKDRGTQPGLSRPIRDLPQAVFAGRAVPGTDRLACGRRRLHRTDHGQQLHEAGVRQEADRGVLSHGLI